MKTQIGYKRIQIAMHDLVEENPRKTIHTFCLNTDVLLQFKEACKDRFSMSSIIEEMMEIFIDAHQDLKKEDK